MSCRSSVFTDGKRNYLHGVTGNSRITSASLKMQIGGNRCTYSILRRTECFNGDGPRPKIMSTFLQHSCF